jgi:hypothetical protein
LSGVINILHICILARKYIRLNSVFDVSFSSWTTNLCMMKPGNCLNEKGEKELFITCRFFRDTSWSTTENQSTSCTW